MNEIKISVTSNLGTITTNFEEAKELLRQQVEVYKNIVYTDDNIKDAKKDVAELRKKIDALEGERKAIKKTWNQPYDKYADQVKEMVAIINEPISIINEKIEDYERRRLDARKKEIREYFDSVVGYLADDAERIYQHIYDSKWENVSTSKKAFKSGIDSALSGIRADIDTIRSFRSDFEQDMMEAYRKSFALNQAIQKMNELDAQRKRVLAMEEARKAEEARRQKEEADRKAAEEERRKAEEARRLEEARKAEEERIRKEETACKAPEEETYRNTEEVHKEEIVAEAPQPEERNSISVSDPDSKTVTSCVVNDHVSADAEASDEPEYILLKVYGDAAQAKKLMDYASFMGIKVVPVE